MGGLSAMSSIRRVLDAHGEEMIREMTGHIPEAMRDTVTGVELEGKNYSIATYWVLKDGCHLEGPEIDIDTLAERYPDCNVGY